MMLVSSSSSSSTFTTIPALTQSPKAVVKEIKKCIPAARQALRNHPTLLDLRQSLKELYPKGFSISLELLNRCQSLCGLLLTALPNSNSSKQSLTDLQTALQCYSPQVFALHFQAKALGNSASYAQLKLPCLGRAEQALQDTNNSDAKVEAEHFWSYCRDLLPEVLYNGLRFDQEIGQILETMNLLKAHLNTKADLAEKVGGWIKTAEDIQGKPDQKSKEAAKIVKERLQQLEQDLPKYYEGSSYDQWIENIKRLRARMVLIDGEEPYQNLVSTLGTLHVKALDYEINSLQSPEALAISILSKVSHELESGHIPEGLIRDLESSRFGSLIGNRKVLPNYLHLLLWIEENESRLTTKASYTFNEHIENLKNLLSEQIKIAEEKQPVTSQHVPATNPQFDQNLVAKMAAFSAALSASNIPGAAEQAIQLVQLLKGFMPIDESQKQSVRQQCANFRSIHEESCEVCAKVDPKNPNWKKIIRGLFAPKGPLRLFSEGTFPSGGTASSSGGSQPNYDEITFHGRINAIKEALHHARLAKAVTMGNDLKGPVRHLGSPTISGLKTLLQELEGHQSTITEVSVSRYIETLRRLMDRLSGLAGGLVSQKPKKRDEKLGDAYTRVLKIAQYRDADAIARRAAAKGLDYYRAAFQQSPSNASLLLAQGTLYQFLGDREAMLQVCKDACKLQPDYFEAISRMGNELCREGRIDEMQELYRRSSHYPLIDTSQSKHYDGGAQIFLHRNYIMGLMRNQCYVEALPLLIGLKNHLIDNPGPHYRIIDEVIDWILRVPEEVSRFQAKDYEQFLDLISNLEVQNHCEILLYRAYLMEGNDVKARECKWRALAGRAVTTPRFKALGEVAIYDQFSPLQRRIQRRQALVAKYPQQFTLYSQLYQLYLKAGQQVQAQRIHDRLLGLSFRAFSLSDSFMELFTLLARQSIHPDIYCDVASAFRDQRRYAVAEKLYNYALQIDHNHLETRFEMGRLLQQTSRFQEAQNQFQEVLGQYDKRTQDPKYLADRYYNLLIANGNEASNTRNREYCRSHFSEACKFVQEEYQRERSRLFTKIYCEMAKISQDRVHALEYLDQAIDLSSDCFEAHYQKAHILHDSLVSAVGSLNRAILGCRYFFQKGYRLLETHIENYPREEAANVYQEIGAELLRQNRTSEALYNVEIAAALHPESQKIRVLLGRCYFKQKRYGSARAAFSQAGSAEAADRAEAQYQELCPIPVYGEFFKMGLERIRSCLYSLRLAEIQDISEFFITGSTEASFCAKNRRQDLLLQSQNLLNQSAQLICFWYKQAYPDAGELPDEFPVRKMDARQRPFSRGDLGSLLKGYQENHPPLYKFVKDFYINHHQAIERFIQEAGSEKHAQHGRQYLGSQTIVRMDHRNNSESREVQPMFWDVSSGKNPAKYCGEIVALLEQLVHNSLEKIGQIPLQLTGTTHFDLEKSIFLSEVASSSPPPSTTSSIPTPAEVRERAQTWGDVAYQIEEARKLISELEKALASRSLEAVFLHADIVTKLTASLDHAIYDYCLKRFGSLQTNDGRSFGSDPLLARALFFPVASSNQDPKERVQQVFQFLSQFGTTIEKEDPSFYTYLYGIADSNTLQILHDASNIEKHRRFKKAEAGDADKLLMRTPTFYRQLIQEIEQIHTEIAKAKQLP